MQEMNVWGDVDTLRNHVSVGLANEESMPNLGIGIRTGQVTRSTRATCKTDYHFKFFGSSTLSS